MAPLRKVEEQLLQAEIMSVHAKHKKGTIKVPSKIKQKK
jgi:hypothetical protein